jgi:hypothetical protein
MSTTRLVGLLIVHGRTRCPSRGWYAEEPPDKGERAVGFMVSTTTGTGEGGRGAEAQTFPGLTGLDTSRQRSKLAEGEGSQEGGKGRKSDKWVTRPRGGGVKKYFGEKTIWRQ